MLGVRRRECLEEIEWNRCHGLPYAEDNETITVLDFWRYERGVQNASESQNYRCLNLAAGKRQTKSVSGKVESDLQKWLNFEGPYQLPSPEGGQKPSGGLRLVLCERRNMTPSMTISKDGFLAIEQAFNLHPATLPLLNMVGGAHVFPPRSSSCKGAHDTLHIVIKTPMKRDVSNFTLSLSHKRSHRWTYAFICGDSVILDRPATTMLYGNQHDRLVESIKAAVDMWDHPILLPFVLTENYIFRIEKRAHTVDHRVQQLEERLGVTWGARSWQARKRGGWPKGVNTTKEMFHLHSASSQLAMLSTCCRWLQGYAAALSDVARDMEGVGGFTQHEEGLYTLGQTAETFCSMSESIQARFCTLKDRADQQMNLIYNIISQQTSQTARRDAMLSFRVAESGKQDSISMTTFTFITALFLPGTFIATLFSMTMFDWQIGDGGEGIAGSSSNSAQSNVSGKFWIFWAIAIPLTLTTMAAWFFWSRYAKQQWMAKLRSSEDFELGPDLQFSPSPSSTPLEPGEAKFEQLASSSYLGLTDDKAIRSWWRALENFDDDTLTPSVEGDIKSDIRNPLARRVATPRE